MKDIKMPVLDVKMVPTSKVVGNDYNPNRVAPPEMRLLKHSIEHDGYTQPIVVVYDPADDRYTVVDGFHRLRCAQEWNLPEVPVVVLEHRTIADREAATVRHNRARGTHQIDGMTQIVADLKREGKTEPEVCDELGMELDEITRLQQASLPELFAGHEFSKSWTEFREKHLAEPQP